MTEIIGALKRISHISITTVGDSCKKDLITLAYACSLNDNVIHENFPEFFKVEDELEIEPETGDEGNQENLENEEDNENQGGDELDKIPAEAEQINKEKE